MTGRMMVKGAFRAGFAITTSPHARIHCEDGFSCFQWMLSQECFGRLAVDLPIDEGIVNAAPAALKTSSQAQMRWGENRASRQQRIGEVKERIATPSEELIHLLTKVRQRFQGRGFHASSIAHEACFVRFCLLL